MLGAFGAPMALLVVDIVLRLMMVQKDDGMSIAKF